MRILAELEAYRDRLIERAAGWPEAPEDELLQDMNRCLEQMSLLEKGIAALERQLESAPDADRERLSRRMAIQKQTYELTAAYVVVLRRHIDGRAS